MKLSKKGFTLVELLAVVVILLAISVIAVSSISAAMERNKEKQNNAKIEVILSYAKLYYEEHENTEKDGKITLDGELKDYLSDKEKEDADGNIFSGIVCYDTGGINFRYDDNFDDGVCN